MINTKLDPKKIADIQELLSKLLSLEPYQRAIVLARVDQMLMDQIEMKQLRKELEIAHALLAGHSA